MTQCCRTECRFYPTNHVHVHFVQGVETGLSLLITAMFSKLVIVDTIAVPAVTYTQNLMWLAPGRGAIVVEAGENNLVPNMKWAL